MRKGKEIICIICGKSKYYNPYRIKYLAPKYCSNPCKQKAFVNPNPFSKVLKKCSVCSKEVYRPLSRSDTEYTACSKGCHGKISVRNLGSRMSGKSHSQETRKKMSKSMRGKKHKLPHEYVQPVHKVIRQFYEYRCWREAVYKRDDFTCQKCEQWGGKLQVHHIIPFSVIIKYVKMSYGEDDIVTKVFKFPLTFDVSNGVTLCKECHKNTDTYLKVIPKKVVEENFIKIGNLIKL